MTFADAFARASRRTTDATALIELAEAGLEEGEEERALLLIADTPKVLRKARLWQWKGLLERSLDEHRAAIASFEEAARLEPDDASIAHGLARVMLEAGLPAEAAFERALKLGPSDRGVLLGRAAARLAAGRGEQAEAELDGLLLRSPLWIDGHKQIAQLRSTLGRRDLATSSVDRALAAHPAQAPLWQALFELHIKQESYVALEEAIKRARACEIAPQLLRAYAAIAESELGRTEEADRLLEQMAAADRATLPIWRIRHLLRSGRVAECLPVIDRELAGPGAADTWPYAAVAWRAARDRRWDWLSSRDGCFQVFDLRPDLPQLTRLAEVLRSIHVARGEYLDQSVRGGTQTDGPLFSRIEPEIRALRAAVSKAVGQYVAQLPSRDPRHPLLGPRRDKIARFAGSWSVRLRGGGFHTSHVHPQGWISSALYVALPPEEQGAPEAGCIQIGEPPPELGMDLPPLAVIKPQPGHLVLFPSWMWHGTRPFGSGERLTVAFDVAVPRS